MMQHKFSINQRGFSLIELMVGLAIGVFLIAGTLSVYQESQSAILVSERMARMQESGRYAISVIEEDIRAVGLWGLLNSTEYVAGRATPADAVDIAVTGDCQVNWVVNIDTPIEGFDNSNGYAATCLSGVNYVNNSDVLVLRHADERDLTAADLGVGGIYLRSDQTHAEIFAGTTLPNGFAPDARINEIRAIAYFISDESDSDADTPSLRRAFVDMTGATPTIDTEEVISGIEDFQVQYGVDLSGDGSANSYLNADDVVDEAQIVALRLWLRLRTSTPEIGFDDEMSFLYSDQLFSAATTSTADDDPYRRAVLSKTIELRNRRVDLANGT
ncbi:MAG: PilW family protein [Gammaproteobacteria bacterium]